MDSLSRLSPFNATNSSIPTNQPAYQTNFSTLPNPYYIFKKANAKIYTVLFNRFKTISPQTLFAFTLLFLAFYSLRKTLQIKPSATDKKINVLALFMGILSLAKWLQESPLRPIQTINSETVATIATSSVVDEIKHQEAASASAISLSHPNLLSNENLQKAASYFSKILEIYLGETKSASKLPALNANEETLAEQLYTKLENHSKPTKQKRKNAEGKKDSIKALRDGLDVIKTVIERLKPALKEIVNLISSFKMIEEQAKKTQELKAEFSTLSLEQKEKQLQRCKKTHSRLGIKSDEPLYLLEQPFEHISQKNKDFLASHEILKAEANEIIEILTAFVEEKISIIESNPC